LNSIRSGVKPNEHRLTKTDALPKLLSSLSAWHEILTTNHPINVCAGFAMFAGEPCVLVWIAKESCAVAIPARLANNGFLEKELSPAEWRWVTEHLSEVLGAGEGDDSSDENNIRLIA